MLLLTAILLSLQVGGPSVETDQALQDRTRTESSVGVVWTAPESSLLAIAELVQIRSVGIRMVRTGPIVDDNILSAADTLGLTLYRELPVNRYASRQLIDSTRYASVILGRLLASGSGHLSAGPIGLAVLSDVSNPEACTYLSSLQSGFAGARGQEYYYVGSFVEDDACSETVDFVLLDALDNPHPDQILVRWAAAGRRTPAGLSAIGQWIDIEARSGLGIDHSAEEQARALEKALASLKNRIGEAPLFVHRWSDQTVVRGGDDVVWDTYGRRYGLNDPSGTPRPALNVLSTFLTTGQDVFAFTSGESPVFKFPWFLLLGWFLIVVVAVLYASSPRFRFMAPRYFVAHGFFRNAVSEAREVLPIVSTALLSIMGIAVGQIGTQVFLSTHNTEPVRHFVSLLPHQAQSIAIAMLNGPLLSVILIGSLALLGMAGWMGLWMIVASRKAPLLPSQALMLGVWPRWQLLLLLPMAMSIHTLSEDTSLAWMTVLIPLWLGTALWATFRTAYDLRKITRCGTVAAVVVWLLNPVWIGIVALIIFAVIHGDQTSFLWHLAIRS